MSGTEIVRIVLGKSKNSRCFKKRIPVIYEANKNSWMTRPTGLIGLLK